MPRPSCMSWRAMPGCRSSTASPNRPIPARSWPTSSPSRSIAGRSPGRSSPGWGTATMSRSRSSRRRRVSASRSVSPAPQGIGRGLKCWNGPRRKGADVDVTIDPEIAVAGAACVLTDTWLSMADIQDEAAARAAAFAPYQVTAELMAQARAGRHLPALPACSSRRGSHGRGHRRPGLGGVRRGGKPAACAEGDFGLVPGVSFRS